MVKGNNPLLDFAETESRGGGYGKAFLVSAGAGAVFGLAAAVVYLQVDEPPWRPALFSAGLALLAGLFSGLAGMGATYLDRLFLRWGVKKPLPRLSLSFAVIALLTFSIAFAGVTVFGVVPLGEGQRYVVWMMLSGLAFGAAFALINYLVWRSRQKMLLLELENRHLAELASREALLREAARNMAVTEERNRMARELHDSIAQGIHGIVYALRPLRAALAGSERGLEILGHLEQTAGGTLKELRRLVMELSPSPVEGQGLSEALRLHCELFARRQQVGLVLRPDYDGGLQPEQEMAAYRVVQEALANVQQHAGADQVTVQLKSEGGAVTLSVRDNGRGFEPGAAPRGRGLANMEARARQSGGHFQVDSAPGKGTEIKIVWGQA